MRTECCAHEGRHGLQPLQARTGSLRLGDSFQPKPNLELELLRAAAITALDGSGCSRLPRRLLGPRLERGPTRLLHLCLRLPYPRLALRSQLELSLPRHRLHVPPRILLSLTHLTLLRLRSPLLLRTRLGEGFDLTSHALLLLLARPRRVLGRRRSSRLLLLRALPLLLLPLGLLGSRSLLGLSRCILGAGLRHRQRADLTFGRRGRGRRRCLLRSLGWHAWRTRVAGGCLDGCGRAQAAAQVVGEGCGQNSQRAGRNGTGWSAPCDGSVRV